MAKRSLIITGNVRLTRMLNALASNKAREVHRKALRRAIKPVLEEARLRAPVRSGAFRKSLTVRATKRSRKSIGVHVTQRRGMFKGKEFYGGFQEFGWRLGTRKKQYRRKGKTRVEDTRKKIPGKWFMRQAGKAKEKQVIEIYELEVEKLIQQEANR